MEGFMSKAVELLTTAGSKIILALLIFIVGRIVIGKIMKFLEKLPALKAMDATVRSFMLNFVKVGLYAILVISIISVLGVPMASGITVLASAGVAVGLALQGALSNLAGGIMLLIFRPFNVGDYVVTAGEEGTVKAISLFYTVLMTNDNRKITIPNGSLMNANVTNCSSEQTRRVDLVFSCAKGEDITMIQRLMIDTMEKNRMILKNPAPFARLSGGTNESMEFTVRAWTQAVDYWEVYFGLTQDITQALGEAGVKAPAVRVITEAK
jgi:small conductance mechanosensitive channel